VPSPTQTGDPNKVESKAWIAGAVVGPLLGLAFVVAGIFLWRRRKAARNNPSELESSKDYGQYAPMDYYRHYVQGPVEMPHTQRTLELDGERKVAELSN